MWELHACKTLLTVHGMHATKQQEHKKERKQAAQYLNEQCTELIRSSILITLFSPAGLSSNSKASA